MENLTIRRESDILMLKYAGEITLEVTADCKRRLDKELGEGEVRAVVADLSGVSFLDSSGIGLLVSINTRMRSSGKAFYLYQLSQPVERTLGLVQLLDFFQVIKDDAALAGICG